MKDLFRLDSYPEPFYGFYGFIFDGFNMSSKFSQARTTWILEFHVVKDSRQLEALSPTEEFPL